jgi:hypothetical protein
MPFELPVYGAFFSGDKFNFIVFGQRNTEQNDSKEVIRIVKYDKSFNRLGSVSVNGGDAKTRIPFNLGCPRMAENGDTLILHTSRELYTIRGENHQANLTISIDTAKMTATFVGTNYPENYVSHSFDQYVLFDGDMPVFLDHGDAAPRSVVLHRPVTPSSYFNCDRATMFPIPGKDGANATGVSVGGFEMSEKNYLTAISTIDHSKVTEYTDFSLVGLDDDRRDIVVCILPRDFEDGAEAKQITIGRYIGTKLYASTPKLIANGNDTFIVLWQEFSHNGDHGAVIAQIIDGYGKTVGDRRRYKDAKEFYKEFFSNPLDTASGWARTGIQEAVSKGFVLADIQGSYTKVITRQEFCRMAVKWVEYATGKSIDTVLAEKGLTRRQNAFQDTTNPDILAAYALGITSGTNTPTADRSGTFSPNSEFSREQAATMIRNTCRAIGMDVDNPPSSGFTDTDAMSGWAVESINFCFANGIMNGTGNDRFDPKRLFTREQSIVMFNNIKR